MKRGADNYYLILELDFMKPESDIFILYSASFLIGKKMRKKYTE